MVEDDEHGHQPGVVADHLDVKAEGLDDVQDVPGPQGVSQREAEPLPGGGRSLHVVQGRPEVGEELEEEGGEQPHLQAGHQQQAQGVRTRHRFRTARYRLAPISATVTAGSA